MSSTTDETKAPATPTSAINRAIAWWHETRDRWRRLSELQGLAPGELDRLSHDMGISAAELTDMAAMPLGVPTLLAQRLQKLDLSTAEIEHLSPLLLADLSRTCSKCSDQRRCTRDMASADGSSDWRHYCGNVGTLDLLAAELHQAPRAPQR